MNREIKFRAWDKINKRWIDLFELKFSGTGAVMGIVDLEGETYGRHQVELVEFTGLKDKNRKGIYEGGIIKLTRHFMGEEYNDSEIGIVSSRPGEFTVKIQGRLRRLTWGIHNCNIEVIGNVYENPELLTDQDA